MNSKICLNYSTNLESCTLDNITALIKEMLPLILEEIFRIILLGFAEKYKESEVTDKCDCSYNASSSEAGQKKNLVKRNLFSSLSHPLPFSRMLPSTLVPPDGFPSLRIPPAGFPSLSSSLLTVSRFLRIPPAIQT